MKKKEHEEDRGKEIACRNCGAVYLPYGRVQHNECPTCGYPPKGKPKGGKKRKVPIIILLVGLALLAGAIILLVMKKGS